MDKKTGSFNLSMIWFGAAVSVAEIATGALLMPLGLARGLAAIFIGHAIGFALLVLAGVIGARGSLSSAESTRISFGSVGSYFFSVANILQLVGWTAIMIASAASSINAISAGYGLNSVALWSGIIGALIAVWILIGLRNLTRVNVIAVGALLVLCVLLGIKAFGSGALGQDSYSAISFGGAVELSVAMPLSWLPLIADYTREAKKPVSGAVVSSAAYFVGSCFMYAIGLGAALFARSADVGVILMSGGLGIAALVIILLSTVTTTFLDAYSAGVSAANLSKRIHEKHAALITVALGVALAIGASMDRYMDFLYLIGSVFAPLFAILFVDYFLLGRKGIDAALKLDIKNAALWAIGFVAYRLMLGVDFALGATLPVMLGVAALRLLVYWGEKLCLRGR